MFCPKCGEELVLTNHHLFCEKGDMYLSQHLAERLNDCFILKIDTPKELQFSFVVGGNWFCPADKTKMTEDNGYVKCPKCNLSFNEFIFQLIEYHPHELIYER